MTKLNKIIIAVFLFCAILIIFSGLNLFKYKTKRQEAKIAIAAKQFKIEVATNPEQWQRGLSERENLCANCGMLFVFPDKKSKEFWMKDMLFPLDIIWLNDQTVVGVSQNLPAPQKNELPVIVQSPEDVNMVLEINSGQAQAIKIGDQAKVSY